MSYLKDRKRRQNLSQMYGGEIEKSQGRPGTHGYNGGMLAAQRRTDANIAEAVGNDYDVRRYMEATGNESAIGNLDQANAIHKEMRKQHREDGQGGKYSSAQDQMGVMMGAVQDQRKQQESKMRDKFKSMLKKTRGSEQTADALQPEAPVELSDRAKKSEAILDKYTMNLGRGRTDVFDTRAAEMGAESPSTNIPDLSSDGQGIEDITSNSTLDDTDEQLKNTMDFKNNYSFNVAKGLNLAGVETRGPNAQRFGA